MRKLSATIVAVVLTLVLVLMSAGCASPAKQVTVGNKNFTEQYLAGEMMKQLLEAHGFTVNLVSDISTMALREGMKAGDIDICAEYTGTAWMTHLGHVYEPGVDNNELYDMVKNEESGNGFIWLDPIWNNNTYAMASWPEFAKDNDIESLSDLAALYNSRNGEIETFVDFEFSTRPDGLPALEKFYGFEVAKDSLMTAAPGASLLGLENHECEIAMVFGTDALIAKHDWHVYLDDKAFFPPYDLSPYVRAEILDEYPEIADILGELVATFPGGGGSATPEIVGEGQGVWQKLNAKVDIDKVEPEDVAHEYLVAKGLITG
ncbi:MAG: glycine betaine ABC transporter substrate-binding protein [Chloroflexota bacterium]|nr:glycine betaine ABC transporter substrate-binding protein [Chloroflexota bacterium]